MKLMDTAVSVLTPSIDGTLIYQYELSHMVANGLGYRAVSLSAPRVIVCCILCKVLKI